MVLNHIAILYCSLLSKSATKIYPQNLPMYLKYNRITFKFSSEPNNDQVVFIDIYLHFWWGVHSQGESTHRSQLLFNGDIQLHVELLVLVDNKTLHLLPVCTSTDYKLSTSTQTCKGHSTSTLTNTKLVALWKQLEDDNNWNALSSTATSSPTSYLQLKASIVVLCGIKRYGESDKTICIKIEKNSTSQNDWAYPIIL